MPLSPNPCLVAVFLIVKTRAGPRLIFHYPPNPGEGNLPTKSSHGTFSDGGSTSSSDGENDYISSDDVQRFRGKKHRHAGEHKNVDHDLDESGSTSPEKSDSTLENASKPGTNQLFGLDPYGLVRMLCPASTNHKKKFEMSIDDLVYVGWPVFSRENGEWQKKRRAKKAKNVGSMSKKDGMLGDQGHGNSGQMTAVQMNDELGETSGQDTGIEDQPDFGNTKSNGIVETAHAEVPKTRVEESKQHSSKEVLNMFHIVCVLDPPPLEYHLRVKEMYDHVVKKFSRALKWEQARSDYVLKEATIIRDLQAKAAKRDLNSAPSYQELISQSSLAKAISVLYNCISTSRIAHINLTPTLSISLQIPIPKSASVLPTPTSPQLPGLWLTTATSVPTDDEIHTTGSQLAAHFALLLLTDLPTILADVNATASPLTGPLTHYLRVSTPTKSFLQISQSSGIKLSDIQFLASHLIYWRRARAIPPLHQRDTYIVSPNADMRTLSAACKSYARHFPSLPILPKVLSLLSTPRPYASLIPSKDHKPAYLEILAWLMRGGWVTQLRTFAWVRVPPHIALEAERKKDSDPNSPSSPHLAEPPQNDSSTHDDAGPSDIPSSSTSVFSDTASISSTRTTIPFSQTLPHPPSQLPSATIILHPTRANSTESTFLSVIASHIANLHGEEVKQAWETCLKYFNGQHALEKIAVREGWKRKRVAEHLALWDAMGVLVRVRHW